MIAGLGVVVALLTWPVLVVVEILVIVAVGCLLILVLGKPQDSAGEETVPGLPTTRVSATSSASWPAVATSWPRTWVDMTCLALRVGAGVMAFAAVVALVPWLALCCVALALVSSPWCLDWLTPTRFATSAPPSQPLLPGSLVPPARSGSQSRSVAPAPSRVPTLTDAELCLAWRRSFVRLQDSTNVAGRVEIVHERQMYLDELEERDPAALQAWIAAGARAAGSPERHLSHKSSAHQ